MPIPILGIAVSDQMAYFRVRGLKYLPITKKLVKDFWCKPANKEKSPNLVKECPDEDEGEDIVLHLKNLLTKHSWASSWGIESEDEVEPDMNIENILDDEEVASKLLDLLVGWSRSEGVNNNSSVRARVMFSGHQDPEQLHQVVKELSIETLIALKDKELAENVENVCSKRVWNELAEMRSNAVQKENENSEVLKENVKLKALLAKKEETINNLNQALNDDEKLIMEQALSAVMKELELRGYVEPKRRVCLVCRDSKEHPPFEGDLANLNHEECVEGLCPLIKPGQRCLQCTKQPPECYSNETLLICKAVVEKPCDITVDGLLHSSFKGKRKHTKDIHLLNKKSDGTFIKKLKGQYGTWILPEYKSEEEELEWSD